MEAEAELLTLMILLFISSNSCSDGVSPFFSKEPTSATVFLGQNVTLTCEAGPCCGVRVQWLYNGTYLSDLPPNKRPTVSGSELTVASFSASSSETKEFYNAEIYQCVATNRLGSIISKPATITYAGGERLVIVSAHQTITAFEGNNVILPCRSAVKTACLSVEWEHNGSHLRLTSRHKILPSNSIQIEDFVGRDIGTYRCLCFNSLTSYQPVSSSVHLKVESSSTNFTSSFVWASPRNQQVVEGQTLVLECSAVGRPRPLVTWLRYGGILSPERHSQDRGVLSVRQVNRSDEGTYICRAENTAGPQQIHVVFVEVLQPPIIVSPPADQETTRGGRVTFTCRSRGLPRPSLTWYHNAVPVVKSAFAKITGDGALVLAEVAENQSGIYQCMASNAVNSTSASARLTVHPNRLTNNASHSRPGVVNQKGRRNFQVLRSKRPIRTSVTITTTMSTPSNFPVNENNLPEAEGDAKEQTKEAKLMQSDGTRRPSHKKPKPRDSLRPAYWTQKITGLSLVPPSKPSAKVVTDTSVELKWTKGHQTTGLNVTLFKVQFKEIKAQKRRKSARWQTIDEDISPDITRFTVGNLKPGSAYQFRLVAIYSNNDNKHGPNSDQVLMSVTGQQVKIPLTAPIIVAVNPLSDSEMSIKWQYLPIKREIATGFMIHHKPYETSVGYKQFVVHGIERRETILSGLFQDTTYSLRMQTFNSEGLSEYSNTAVKKTFGPSDNSTDIYPLQNHTPPLFYPLNNDHRPSVNENGDDPFETPRNTGTTSGAESNVPWNRASYSQQNRDMLFVVLGVVLGGVFIVVIFIIVFCLWRQRQHQLFLAAAEARSKPRSAQSAFHANSLAVMELKNFAGEPIKNSNACGGKRTPAKKNHIPNYFGNGCHVNSGGSSRSKDYLENGNYCNQRRPADEGHQLLQHLSTNKSITVCQQHCTSANGLHDHESANSVNGWHCDTSDGTGSKGQLPSLSSSADCSDIYNSEGHPRRAPCFRPSLHEEPVETPPSECAACDQFSCRRRHLPSPLASPLNDPLPPTKRSCASSSSSSSSSDSSSSSLSSSLSGCSYNCHRQQQRRHFEKNDSGVYDEHSCETRSENKTQLLPQLPSDSNEICAI